MQQPIMSEHSIETDFGIAKIHDYKDINKDGDRILVVPGFSTSGNHLAELMNSMHDEGLNSFTFSQPRNNISKPDIDPINRQAEIITSILDAELKEGEQVYAVAHSLGAAALLKAAIANPERFLGILLMQPIGLITDKLSLAGLMKSSIYASLKNTFDAANQQNNIDNVTPSQVVALYNNSIREGVKNPQLTLKEAAASTEYNITDDLNTISGIPIDILLSNKDEFFGTATKENIPKGTTNISSISDKNAPHNTFWLHPNRTAKLIKHFSKNK